MDIELFNFGWTDGSGYKDGALVSDGVDDNGQCVKDFILPNDYTVCAIRKYSTNLTNSGALISKNRSPRIGAFQFEVSDNGGYSYGTYFQYDALPVLFSYQTKSSYNGNDITPGIFRDSSYCKLCIFNGDLSFKRAALYSFGIFTRTLTAEELTLVEDCMYLELEYNTNILDNIEYYDILDARYRSNEEAEDKRNKWNGRLGKLHLTLNNYAYSGMSGWNGWPTD